MQTDGKYLGDEIYIVMAGGTPPEFIREAMQRNHRSRVEDPDDNLIGPPSIEFNPQRAYKPYGEEPKIDGQVTFYDPELLDSGETFKHGTYPFRSKNKHGIWCCYPNRPKWEKHPVWKWTNPGESPYSNLTLSPSIAIGNPIRFHCNIRNGEIGWL